MIKIYSRVLGLANQKHNRQHPECSIGERKAEGSGEDRLFYDVTTVGQLDPTRMEIASRNPLRDCLVVIGIPSDINQHPSPTSCSALGPGTGYCPDLVKHVDQFPHLVVFTY